MAMPNRAVMMGRPMATTEPKARSMMMMAAEDPDAFARARFGAGHQLDGLTTHGDLVARCMERLGGIDDLLDSSRGQVARLLVELDPQVGDVPVRET